MRNRLTSGLLPRFAAAAAMLAALPSVVGAWDEDRVQSQLQPYFGAWAGMYMVNREDLGRLARVDEENFSAIRPAAGLSFGVAYSRLHIGINGGYQLIDGDKNMVSGYASPVYEKSYYYRYQVIPLDASLEVALLPNEYPVNLLLGGSAGIGLVGLQLPFYELYHREDTLNITTYYSNEWSYNNFLLATGYVGARINLARRLNLEGQLGYRVLKGDEVYLGHGYTLVKTFQTAEDDSGRLVETRADDVPVSLSSFYFRADIRWTFASQSEKDEDRVSARRREMAERIAMLPPRARIVD